MWKASPNSARLTSSTQSNSAIASSCWASPSAQTRGIELRVHPSLIPAKRLIANVEGAMNAVVVQW
jgi:homoserine dehydrogenase